MKLTAVTLTGADDSVMPEDLLNISLKYPFVEWGILLSRNQIGGKRFPSLKWMQDLRKLKNHFDSTSKTGNQFNLSGHLCGGWVREILLGERTMINELGQDIWDMFSRVQINTHGVDHDYGIHLFDVLRNNKEKEFIFQYDEVNKQILNYVRKNGFTNISTLFDLSHGTGTLPKTWPQALLGIKCGYAGGLGPDNLEEQLPKIAEDAIDNPFWVDMETLIRSNNDLQFDLDKCIKIAELSKPYYKSEVDEILR